MGLGTRFDFDSMIRYTSWRKSFGKFLYGRKLFEEMLHFFGISSSTEFTVISSNSIKYPYPPFSKFLIIVSKETRVLAKEGSPFIHLHPQV